MPKCNCRCTPTKRRKIYFIADEKFEDNKKIYVTTVSYDKNFSEKKFPIARDFWISNIFPTLLIRNLNVDVLILVMIYIPMIDMK